MAEHPTDVVAATDTSLRILEELKDLDGAGVTELANSLDLAKSTVHYHLATLLKNQYIIKEGDTYRVGLRFLEYGEFMRGQMDIYKIGQPEVDKVAGETGELVNLAVEEHGLGVYIYRAKGSQAVNLDTYAGMRVNLHCTALGKAILANLPESEVNSILDRHGMPERTKYTITDRTELQEELDDIRNRGYSTDNEERLLGLKCIAAPITDDEDRPVGAISVSGPTSRMQGDTFSQKIPDITLNAANVIELNMTYS